MAAALSEPAPALVTVHLWRVPAGRVPQAVTRMALDRRPVRRLPGVRFAKLLGTGSGHTFTVLDANPRRWALLISWESRASAAAFERSRVARAWGRLADERCRLQLRPLASRGRWSGHEPFGDPAPRRYDGPVAALTRARLVPRKAVTFWRAVPPVSADLQHAAGLRLAVAVGEAPIGLQGTFSVWDSPAAISDFAHRGCAHLTAIRRTGTEGWYAEELFARFALEGGEGTVDGRDPLAARVDSR